MAWSPHQHGLLASGGGTADRTIRFWNTLTATPINVIDAGSQSAISCSSKTVNELVSTHGYSQNEINIWKYPKMEKISTTDRPHLPCAIPRYEPLGHYYRNWSRYNSFLFLGDETLRFWNVFTADRTNSRKDPACYPTELFPQMTANCIYSNFPYNPS